jgi:biotin carboxyl carrier protein
LTALDPGAISHSSSRSGPHRRSQAPFLIVPILLILVTFLFWYQTWFGRRLTNREMGEYLVNTSVPHKTQHALAQMAERMVRGDTSVKQWYPNVLALARNSEPEFRLTAAWVMGQDNSSQKFHQALLDLLHDPEPTVRWNAALALVRFGDPSGEPQLSHMLQPYTVLSPRGGSVHFVVRRGDPVRTGGIIARIEAGPAQRKEVRSPLSGTIEALKVSEGANVAPNDGLAVLSPGEDQVWESLRGLYFVGNRSDLEAIQNYLKLTPGAPQRVREQAALTMQAIQARSAAP